ncbi:MAG: serine hydrolase domain-containing protein [Limisphaerales bacterium]
MFWAQSFEDSVDSLLASYDRPDAPGLALGVIKDDRTFYAKGWRMADLEQQIPITPNSVFDVASVSKQFTGLAIAILESENKLNVTCTAGINDWPRALTIQSPGWAGSAKEEIPSDFNRSELDD